MVARRRLEVERHRNIEMIRLAKYPTARRPGAVDGSGEPFSHGLREIRYGDFRPEVEGF